MYEASQKTATTDRAELGRQVQTGSGFLSVYKKTVRDSRRSMIWLSIGLGIYALMIISFFPAMIEQQAEFQDIMDAYPKEMMGLMGGGIDVDNLDFTNPGTFVQTEFTNWMMLILGAMIIVQAFGSFTNAERDGSLDMMLSLPVSRRGYLLATVARSLTMVLVVLTACFLALFLASQIWTEFDVDLLNLALGIYGATFVLMVIGAFTYMLATLVPSSKNFAGALAYLIFIGSFLLYGLSTAVDGLDTVQPLMMFKYYNASNIINNGVDIGDWVILTATSLVFFGVAWWAVDRKELGV